MLNDSQHSWVLLALHLTLNVPSRSSPREWHHWDSRRTRSLYTLMLKIQGNNAMNSHELILPGLRDVHIFSYLLHTFLKCKCSDTKISSLVFSGTFVLPHWSNHCGISFLPMYVTFYHTLRRSSKISRKMQIMQRLCLDPTVFSVPTTENVFERLRLGPVAWPSG